MYVDDLVTDETKRSGGVGKAIMNHLQRIAIDAGCKFYKLDSGTWRQQAHQFPKGLPGGHERYFREGMVVTAFHFAKPLS